MKNLFARTANFAILFVLLPFVYGCQGGGGGPLGFLGGGGFFGGGSNGGGSFVGGGGTFVTGETLATIHNPEPTTMLLLGSGLAAMAFQRARKKK